MKIVSACLAGVKCRYDSKHQERVDIVELVRSGQAIPLCPEQLGGLSTPRSPAEIQNDRVISIEGNDVTLEYDTGATEALKIAQTCGATSALLKSKSPMCGMGKIYDGTYSGNLVDGDGVFTKLLKKNGIEVESID